MGQSCSNVVNKNKQVDVVDLYVFPRTHEALHMSPPCCKVETFLRFAKIPYNLHCTTDFAISPTERLPFAVIDNEVVTDSEAIIERLLQSPKYCPPNAACPHPLSAKELRIGRTLHAALEFSMRFNVMRWQLVDHLDWVVDSSIDYAPSVPRWILKAVLSSKNRDVAISTLNGCGHGDLSHDEYHEKLLGDVKMLEGYIEETGAFILTKDHPSRFDAEVFAMLHLLRIADSIKADAPGVMYALSSAVILGYLSRMDALCFPDMKEQLKNHNVMEQDFSKLQWMMVDKQRSEIDAKEGSISSTQAKEPIIEESK